MSLKKIIILFSVSLFLMLQFNLQAQPRFPKPEFESGHIQPDVQKPAPRAIWLEYFDVFVLISALSLMSWLVLKKRSRRGVMWLSVFSLLYFGFFREGCICSIGSIQNVALALFEPGYAIPFSAIAFFSIPIIYTLFFGRTFCAGVCPMGALQDLLTFKPMQLKPALQAILGLLPFIYLGLAILYAITQTDFIICRYDPFVSFFRLDGTILMLSLGAALLLAGLFVARPYCRFLCPYGALLNLASRISKTHLTITPNECIQCKLCENSCPYGAIQKPEKLHFEASRKKTANRFLLYALFVPVFVLSFSWITSLFHEKLALMNPKVRLAVELTSPTDPEKPESLEMTTFKTTGKSVEQALEEASALMQLFYRGSWLLGAFIGLILSLKLVNLSVYNFQPDYTPKKSECVSCARCVDYCPVEPTTKAFKTKQLTIQNNDISQ